MRRWSILLFIGLCVQPLVSGAQTRRAAPAPATRQLSGLTAEEATALIEKLEDAQRWLRAEQFQKFELLTGSIASYKETNIAPRQAFLGVPFQKVWNVERVSRNDKIDQRYRLDYAPNGLGQLYWEIEVVLYFNGDIERILMTYKPPAPF